MHKPGRTRVRPVGQSYFGQVDLILDAYLQSGSLTAEEVDKLQRFAASPFFKKLPQIYDPALASLFVLNQAVQILLLVKEGVAPALTLLHATLAQIEGVEGDCLDETFSFESLCDPFGGKLYELGALLANQMGQARQAARLTDRFKSFPARLLSQSLALPLLGI